MMFLLASAAFAGLLIVASVKDLTSFTIPNWVSIGLVGLFVIVGPFALEPVQGGLHVAVGIASLIVGIVLFALGWIGGGDAKLAAALMLWMGPVDGPIFLFWTALCGGGLTLALLTVRHIPVLVPPQLATLGWVGQLIDRKSDVPYGVAIAAGALIVLPQSVVFTNLH